MKDKIDIMKTIGRSDIFVNDMRYIDNGWKPKWLMFKIVSWFNNRKVKRIPYRCLVCSRIYSAR